MELLFLIAVGFAFKSAFDHVRTTRKASEGARLKEFAKTFRKGEIPKRKLKGAANRHALGWWLSEAGHGFPVARRGWQAGWIAHRTEAEHHRARLEEAKTTHADVQASVLAGLSEHRDRQAEAKARRDAILAQLRDHPTEAKGRKAVQEADAVVLPFPARPPPPVPSDTVDRKAAPEPGPYRPVPGMPDDFRPDDLRPNDPRCLVCCGQGGRTPDLPCSMCGGWSRDAVEAPVDDAVAAADQGFPDEDERATSDLPEDHELSDWLRPGEPRCPVCDGRGCADCRGWGSAAPDPSAPETAPGTICNACGRPGTEDDPVLAQQGGTNLHRSHAEADPRNQQASPPTGGNAMPVAADTTYDQQLAAAADVIRSADAEIAELRVRRIAQQVENLGSLGLDSGSLSRAAEIDDALKEQEKAAQKVLDAAQAFRDGLVRDHGAVNEAHQNAPQGGAEKAFYQG